MDWTHTMHNEERTPYMHAHAKCKKKTFFARLVLIPSPLSLFSFPTRHDMDGWIGGFDHASKMHHGCLLLVCLFVVYAISPSFFLNTSLKSPQSKPPYTQINTPSDSQTHTTSHLPSRSLPLAQSLSLLSLLSPLSREK